MRKLKISKTTYNLLLLSSMFWTFGFMILGPVYAIFVEGIGGGSLVNVGIAYAASFFATGIFSIPFSRLSDKRGKKNIIILGCLIYLPIPFLYPFVTNIVQVFILQIWGGISSAISDPVWEALLAEVTTKKKRGREYGVLYATNQFTGGVAALVGGIIAQFLGFRYTFFLVGILSIIATSIIFLVEEKGPKKRRRKSRRR